MMKQVDEQVTKTSACFGPLPHFVGCMIGNSNKKLHIQKRPTVGGGFKCYINLDLVLGFLYCLWKKETAVVPSTMKCCFPACFPATLYNF